MGVPTWHRFAAGPGLDVHASKVVAAVVDRESGELAVRRLSGETGEVVGFCAGLPGPARVAYEAGPSGFALARALVAAGVECVMAAPGKIERPAQDRVKTDRRDAERLVRLLMVGGLHAVRVPSVEEEALRDLVRAREDVRGDLMRARHRSGALTFRSAAICSREGDQRGQSTAWDPGSTRHAGRNRRPVSVPVQRPPPALVQTSRRPSRERSHPTRDAELREATLSAAVGPHHPSRSVRFSIRENAILSARATVPR
jgi:transposase